MSKKFLYTEEMLDFLRDNISGKPLKDLTAEFNKKYGTSRSKRQILDTCYCRGWSNGLLHQKTVFPSPVVDYITAHHSGVRPREMMQKLNSTFGTTYSEEQIARFYTKHKLRSGVASTYMPIGTVVFRETEQMYYEKVKDGPNPIENWRPKHQLIWEAAHGPIPEGHIVIFLDGDRTNMDLSNLALCSKPVALMLNKKGLRFSCADATKAGVLIAQITTKILEKQKWGGKRENGTGDN